MKIETAEFTLPDFWASYLVNRDASGLTDRERKEVDECVARFGQQLGGTLDCVSCDEQASVTNQNDWDEFCGIGMTHRFTFHVHRRASK
jgi:hypothetical protein